MLGRELLDQRFAGMKQALAGATDDDRRRVTEMLDDLNDLLDKHARGEDTQRDFDEFMTKHGEFFPENPRNVEELLDSLAKRAAAAQRFRNSLSQEQRDELDALAQQAFGSPALMRALDRLDAHLQAARPGEDWTGSQQFSGDNPFGMGEGTQALADIAELEQLAEQLSQSYPGASMDDVDLDALARQLGDQAAVDARTLAELERALVNQGFLDRGSDGQWRLSPKAMPPPRRNGVTRCGATPTRDRASCGSGCRQWHRRAEPGAAEPAAHLPFRSGRSFSASVSGTELTVKGAPEVVLAACEGIGSSMDDAVAELAANGLRVIAVAHRQLTAQQAQSVVDDPDEIARLCRDELSLVGFLGLSDTPRAQAAALLADLHEHDLDIRLITGDHPITAAAIAEELGMQVSPEQVISGAEWDALSRKDQERAVAERVIFARMTPENKVQIVQTLEHSGRVCAMVGDGSNDAAAIRAATVGIGVVAHGSDPARVAADLVLVDGRIESLLPAILEGRQLWQRVQAAVSVLLGGNAGEVAFAIIGSAITGTSPLNTRQLLLVNMLTDALPAAALAVSKPSDPVTPATRGPDQRELWRAVGIRGAPMRPGRRWPSVASPAPVRPPVVAGRRLPRGRPAPECPGARPAPAPRWPARRGSGHRRW